MPNQINLLQPDQSVERNWGLTGDVASIRNSKARRQNAPMTLSGLDAFREVTNTDGALPARDNFLSYFGEMPPSLGALVYYIRVLLTPIT